MTDRVDAARAYANLSGLVYVPCFRKYDSSELAGTFMPHPLDAPEALKLIVRHGQAPADTIERWWTGVGLDELKLSLCVHCRVQPVANAAGQCWWCEQRPWICQ